MLSGQVQDAAELRHAYAIGGYRGYLDRQLQILNVRSQREYVRLPWISRSYTLGWVTGIWRLAGLNVHTKSAQAG